MASEEHEHETIEEHEYETMNEVLTCPRCKKRYQCNPRMLACQHSLCEACLETMIERSREVLQCPVCRKNHDLTHDIPAGNGLLQTLLDKYQLYNKSSNDPQLFSDEYNACKICHESPEDIDKCFHCGGFVCQSCNKNHLEEVRKDFCNYTKLIRGVLDQVTALQVTISDLDHNEEFLNDKNLTTVFQTLRQIEEDFYKVDSNLPTPCSRDVFRQRFQDGENCLLQLINIKTHPLIVEAKTNLKIRGIDFDDYRKLDRSYEIPGPPPRPTYSTDQTKKSAAGVKTVSSQRSYGAIFATENQPRYDVTEADTHYEDIDTGCKCATCIKLGVCKRVTCGTTVFMDCAKIGLGSWSIASGNSVITKASGSIVIFKSLLELAFIFCLLMKTFDGKLKIVVILAIVCSCLLITDSVLEYFPGEDSALSENALKFILIIDWFWTVFFIAALFFLRRRSAEDRYTTVPGP